LDRHGSRIGLGAERLARVEWFFTSHGARAILVGRFISVVRAVAPFLAGASKLAVREFLPWSLMGTAMWASLFVTVGYAFSSSFERATGTLTKVALGLALVIAGALAVRSRFVPAEVICPHRVLVNPGRQHLRAPRSAEDTAASTRSRATRSAASSSISIAAVICSGRCAGTTHPGRPKLARGR
jgi:hypothetical protein